MHHHHRFTSGNGNPLLATLVKGSSGNLLLPAYPLPLLLVGRPVNGRGKSQTGTAATAAAAAVAVVVGMSGTESSRPVF